MEERTDRLLDKYPFNSNELRQQEQLIEKIVKSRKRSGLTQGQWAEMVGVSQPRIARIENRTKIGKISFAVLFNILAVLGHDLKITTPKVRDIEYALRASIIFSSLSIIWTTRSILPCSPLPPSYFESHNAVVSLLSSMLYFTDFHIQLKYNKPIINRYLNELHHASPQDAFPVL